MEIVKTCIHHGELTKDECKKIIEKRWGIQPNYKYKCLKCIKRYNQTYLHKDNPEHQERIKKLRKYQKEKHHQKLLEGKRRRQKINRDKLNYQAKILRKNNLEKYQQRGRELQKKWRENLNDNYVKTQFKRRYNMKASEVPKWMIDIKREIIRLRRKIREIENGN